MVISKKEAEAGDNTKQSRGAIIELREYLQHSHSYAGLSGNIIIIALTRSS